MSPELEDSIDSYAEVTYWHLGSLVRQLLSASAAVGYREKPAIHAVKIHQATKDSLAALIASATEALGVLEEMYAEIEPQLRPRLKLLRGGNSRLKTSKSAHPADLLPTYKIQNLTEAEKPNDIGAPDRT